MVWVVGMVRPARVVRSMAKKSPVTAMFSHQITPFSHPPAEIPPRPAVLLSSTQSVWVDFGRTKQKPQGSDLGPGAGQNKSPRRPDKTRVPGLGFGLIT